jgi:orotate phosphoribosyltransferase
MPYAAAGFLALCRELGVLRFGEFKLKSGRTSPYFFNAGLFNDGRALAELGRYYAALAINCGIDYDMLFGPAYKGIPLAASAAIALADGHGRNVPWAFNRKEAKDHGEGGNIVGAPLRGRVLILDDVITAGTAIRESLALIRNAGATPAGVLVALDREERGPDERSAIQVLADEESLPVASIAKFSDLVAYLEAADDPHLPAIRTYRATHGTR